MDSSNEPKEYDNYLNVNSYLSNINVSVPEIYEKYDESNILIMEDFGNLRFDKILNNYPLKSLLESAIETLVVIKNQIKFNHSYNH